jgi:F-type H+-transporting ATPase subunit delta
MDIRVAELVQKQWADVGAQRVAGVYAEALLDAADRVGQADALTNEFDSLMHDVLPKCADFATVLASGAVGRNNKADLLQRSLAGKVSELFLNFFLVLNNHERLDLLTNIYVEFHRLRDRRANRVPVEVRTAVPMADDQRNRLTGELRALLQQEPILQLKVDPELIGGMVVRTGDLLFDGSVRSRLNLIRNEVIARSSHEIQSGRDRFGTDT